MGEISPNLVKLSVTEVQRGLRVFPLLDFVLYNSSVFFNIIFHKCKSASFSLFLSVYPPQTREPVFYYFVTICASWVQNYKTILL